MHRKINFEVIYILIVKTQCSSFDLDVGYVEQPIFVKTIWVDTVGLQAISVVSQVQGDTLLTSAVSI